MARDLLFERSRPSVYLLMVRMVGVSNATDMTQQVFLQVFRQLGQFSGRSQIGTWIHRVAVNEALQYLRRSKHSRLHSLGHEPVDNSRNNCLDVDDREQLDHAFARMEPLLRSIFLLRETEGLAYLSIAKALNIPVGTVGSRLNRARKDLRLHLMALGGP